MKKALTLLLMSALFILVALPPGNTELALEKQSIQTLQSDLVAVSDVNFEVENYVLLPVNAVEIEISPGDMLKGVYYSEFSKNNESQFIDVYALVNVDNSKERFPWYRTNDYFICNYVNSDVLAPNLIGKNHKLYQDVGISPGWKQWCHYDTTT